MLFMAASRGLATEVCSKRIHQVARFGASVPLSAQSEHFPLQGGGGERLQDLNWSGEGRAQCQVQSTPGSLFSGQKGTGKEVRSRPLPAPSQGPLSPPDWV